MSESGEKRHAPTERKLRQAAEKGDIRRSADLPRAAAIVLVATITFGAAAAFGLRLQALLAAWLSAAGSGEPAVAAGWAGALATALAPLLAVTAGLSLFAGFFSGGWAFSLESLRPDFSKFMLSHGIGQMFSPTALTETAKSMLKFVIIGAVGAVMIRAHLAAFAALSAQPGGAGAALALCGEILGAICAAVVALAAADVGLQYWLHRRRLRMTDTEMRDEMREAVGNPHVRQRQRAIARRLARGRQMRRIPEASVVVTNPTHFAVAIRYRRGADRAPLLLAKGAGLVAAEIVSRARGFGIPIVEAPPLARAIHRHVEPGDHVPAPLYRACALVLAYVWRMEAWRSGGGVRPQPPGAENFNGLAPHEQDA